MLWYDGALVEGRVPFDLADRGLLLGDGVFDTALSIGGRIAFEEAHVARLAAATATLGFPVDPGRIVEPMRALARLQDRAAIRTTVTRGAGPRGITPPCDPRPLVFASAAPIDPSLACAPLRLHPTAIRRNETSPASRLKTIGYLDAVLAARDAKASGFDDALFLNTCGRVCCAGTANIWMIVEDRLVTPPVEEGALPGIVRGIVIEIAAAEGWRVEERPVTPTDLNACEAVFVTNSLRLLAPVTAIGERAFASPDQPVVRRLAILLRQAVAESCRAAS